MGGSQFIFEGWELVVLTTVQPILHYLVSRPYKTYYFGADENRAKGIYDERKKIDGFFAPTIVTIPMLPADQFQVEKNNNGEIRIIAGKDDTDRCLVFLEEMKLPSGDYPQIDLNKTSGTILGSSQFESGDIATNFTGIVVVAILEPTQQVAFRDGSVYFWDGKEISILSDDDEQLGNAAKFVVM